MQRIESGERQLDVLEFCGLAASLQEEIAADFPAAAHVSLADSGHYIQRDQPTVVINSARQLAGCPPV